MELLERFNHILDEINKIDSSIINKYQSEGIKACQSLGNSKINEILGIETENELNELKKINQNIHIDYEVKNEGFRIRHANEIPTIEIVEKLENYYNLVIKLFDNYSKCTIIYTDLINKMIINSKTTTEKINEINEIVKTLHDPKLAAIDGEMVCHLYSDGEITLEKGGYLYGDRSRHMVAPGFACAKYSFPLKLNNEYTYAILKSSDADNIRNNMK